MPNSFRALLVLTLLIPSAWGSQEQRSAMSGPRVEHIPEGLILEWVSPELILARSTDGQVEPSLPGYATFSEPGSLKLPVSSVPIALPPGSVAILEVLEVEERLQRWQGQVEINPMFQGVLRGEDGEVLGGAKEPAEQAKTFSREVVELEELGILRGVRMARVSFYPVRPAGGQWQFTERVRVRVRFQRPELIPRSAPGASDPILETLLSQVANPDDAVPAFEEQGPSLLEAAAIAEQTATAAIHVSRQGLVRVSQESLANAGFPVNQKDPRYLQIEHDGQEVVYRWSGDDDLSFEPGESLVFYADPRLSRWSNHDVYWLKWGDSPGTRMTERAAISGGLPPGVLTRQQVFEQNTIYTPDCYCAPIPLGRDGDRWVWQRLQVPDTVETTISFDVTGLDPSLPSRFVAWFISYTDVAAVVDHRVAVSVNGVTVGEQSWDGKQAVEITATAPAGVLKEGANQVTFRLPGIASVSVEGVWLDAFAVEFPVQSAAGWVSALVSSEQGAETYQLTVNTGQSWQVLDVTDPYLPVQLSGALSSKGDVLLFESNPGSEASRFWVTQEVVAPDLLRLSVPLQTAASSGADYLVLAPREFWPALQPLIQMHESNGIHVAVEDVEATYDSFGDGRLDPAAIREYLAWVYASWFPRPVYVLLVGDGTADPKQYSVNSPKTWLPPYLEDVDPWAGETASDNRYATVDGDDILPEFLVGRLPANTTSELVAMVEKILLSEAKPNIDESWHLQQVFVADDPDYGGNFYALADQIIQAYIQPPQVARKYYFYPSQATVLEMQQVLLEQWDAGGGIFLYSGHASIHQWGAENFFHLENVGGIQNKERLPILLEMTCFTSAFHVPGFDTLDEALLRSPGGGAAAAWGSTGLGLETGHEDLAEGFFNYLSNDGRNLGAATLAGKLHLAAHHPEYGDLIDTFVLLGDPATSINGWEQKDLVFLPFLQLER